MKMPSPVTISDELLGKIEDIPNQAQKFDSAVRRVMAYPRAAMLRHEAEHRKEVAANPKRRGPKPKPAGPAPDAEFRA
jgi:hypothetical protein